MGASMGQAKAKGFTPTGGGHPGEVKGPHIQIGNPKGK